MSDRRSISGAEITDRRERLRRACEDGAVLYDVRMHGARGLSIAQDNRVDGILTLDLPDALGAFDLVVAALAECREQTAKLEAALFECAKASGADVSDGIPTFPTIDVWAVREVQQLRDDYEAALAEARGPANTPTRKEPT